MTEEPHDRGARKPVRATRRQPISRPTVDSPRSESVRQQIIAAARFVFERDGFHEARIVDISAAAKVGVGTFYRQFPSKSHAFCAVIAEAFDTIHLSGSTRSVANDDPSAAIETANRQFFKEYRRQAKLHSLLEQLAPVDEQCRRLYIDGRARAVNRIAHSIGELQRNGLANPDLEPQQAARLLVSMTNNYAHICFSLGEEFVEEPALATLNRLWIDGLGIGRAY